MGSCISKKPSNSDTQKKTKEFSHSEDRELKQELQILRRKINWGSIWGFLESKEVISCRTWSVNLLDFIDTSVEFPLVAKVFPKSELVGKLELFLNELKTLMTVDHPNVIGFISAFESEEHFYILMEHCQGGNLLERLKEKQRFNEEEATSILYQLLKALSYLHANEICHRDVKLANVLLSGSIVKLIDFGISKQLLRNERRQSSKGTLEFLAPETLQGDYGVECDMWSCGIVMYLMLTGKTPYSEDLDEGEIKEVLKTGRLDFSSPGFQQLSWEAKDLIKKMLCIDPLNRISASGALNHEWFENVYHEKPSENLVERLRTLTRQDIKEKRFLKLVNKFLPHKTLKFYIEKFYSMDTSHLGMINADSLSKGLSPPKNTYISFSDFLVATMDSSSIPDISLQACAKFFVNCSKTDFHTLTCPISYA